MFLSRNVFIIKIDVIRREKNQFQREEQTNRMKKKRTESGTSC